MLFLLDLWLIASDKSGPYLFPSSGDTTPAHGIVSISSKVAAAARGSVPKLAQLATGRIGDGLAGAPLPPRGAFVGFVGAPRAPTYPDRASS